MLTMTDDLSRRLSTVTFIATVLVVMCHVDDIFPEHGGVWLVRFLGGAFTDANVANFFFLTGLFLGLRSTGEGWWCAALAKRVRTLLVPYVLWCLIYFVLSVGVVSLIQLALGKSFSQLAVVQVLSKPDLGLSSLFGLGFLQAPCNFALWYIKTVFWFILVSPPFLYLLKRRGYWALTGLLLGIYLFYCLGNACRLPFMPAFGFGFHLIGFGCFLTGAMIALRPLPLSIRRSSWSASITLVIWIGSAVLQMYLPSPFRGMWVPINIAIEVMMLQCFVAAIAYRVPLWATGTAFFIYASHLIILRVFSYGLPLFGQRLPTSLLYFGILIVTVGVGMGVSIGLKQKWPPLAKLLSGGRS